MKQRIIPEQLQELAPEQQAKLRDLWEPNEGDWYFKKAFPEYPHLYNSSCDPFEVDEPNKEDGDLPLLDIGQMIELLESSKPTLHIDKHLPEGIEKRTMYEVFQQGAGTHWGETLCDALWEAVKKIL